MIRIMNFRERYFSCLLEPVDTAASVTKQTNKLTISEEHYGKAIPLGEKIKGKKKLLKLFTDLKT